MHHITNKYSIRSIKGFTLVELMVALAIAGILMSYAIPSYRDFSIRQSISNQVNNLVTDLTFAKVTAIKQAQQVVVQPKDTVDPNNWSAGWIIFIDGNRNGVNNGPPTDTLLRSEDPVGRDVIITGDVLVAFNDLGSAPNGSYGIEISHYNAPTKGINVAVSGIITSSH